MNNDNIAVSVLCTAFNHEAYIADALEGFVRQNTTFRYEVIVNDDASTDGTRSIIERYASLYPSIIVPVLHDDNQFSKGVSPIERFMLPAARGKYIAFCEGDDCWIDDDKLQKQYEFLELHRDYSICIHNAMVINYRSQCCYLTEPNDGDRDKSLAQLILEGGGYINPTASFFFRKELLKERYKLKTPVGDHFMLIELAIKGKAHWMSKPMSVYRGYTETSWSVRDAKKSEKEIRDYRDSYISALMWYDEFSGHVATDAFGERIKLQENDYRDRVAIRRFCSGKGAEALAGASKVTLLKAVCKRCLNPRLVRQIIRLRDLAKAKRAGCLYSAKTPDISQLRHLVND